MPSIKFSIHNRNLGARKKALVKWKAPDEDKKDLLRFLEDLQLGKVNKGKRISEARQLKYLSILKIPFEFFKRSISTLQLKDVESFEKALTTDRIKSAKGSPFAESTKVDVRRALKIYLRWKYGDTERFRELAGWFDCREPRRTPDYLPDTDIEALFKSCKSNEERFLIAVLFDAGARAEEFHNIRFEDIKLPEKEGSFVRITLKEEYSKTRGRCVSLYWKHSLDAIRDYIRARREEGVRPSDKVFAKKYDNSRRFLNRLGNKVLGRSIHYHLFRHSSATFYASKMNRQQLCYRYGWKFSSDMPDVYICRSGMENSELDEKFKSTELEDVKKENEKLKERWMRTEQEMNTEILKMNETRKNMEFLNKELARIKSATMGLKN